MNFFMTKLSEFLSITDHGAATAKPKQVGGWRGWDYGCHFDAGQDSCDGHSVRVGS